MGALVRGGAKVPIFSHWVFAAPLSAKSGNNLGNLGNLGVRGGTCFGVQWREIYRPHSGPALLRWAWQNWQVFYFVGVPDGI